MQTTEWQAAIQVERYECLFAGPKLTTHREIQPMALVHRRAAVYAMLSDDSSRGSEGKSLQAAGFGGWCWGRGIYPWGMGGRDSLQGRWRGSKMRGEWRRRNG